MHTPGPSQGQLRTSILHLRPKTFVATREGVIRGN